MPRRRTRIAAAENLARGLRGLPPVVVRRGAVVHAVSLTAVVSIESAVALDVSGGVATAGGGDVAYRVGQAVRETVDPKGDTAYVATMAGTGAVVGDFLTGGTAWGAGVGFVVGWVVGVNQLRRR